MTNLRPWQKNHSDAAITKFQESTALTTVFLSQAVTGAGKTTMGAHVAASLLKIGLIERIVVLCPSVEIAKSWVTKLTEDFSVTASFENVDANGLQAVVFTYQGAAKVPGNRMTLVILDEIHHAEREASWGERASALAKDSKFVLCLTGTPWMTRGRIAILSDHGYYQEGDDGVVRVKADETYNYAEDLRDKSNNRATVPVHFTFFDSRTSRPVKDDDGTTRTETLILPKVTDENKAVIRDPKQTNHNHPLSFHVTIGDERLSNNVMARRMIAAGVNKLEEIAESPAFKKDRRFGEKPKPMGLVSCRNIAEARLVAAYISEVHGQAVEIIVSDDASSAETLRKIVKGEHKTTWIVSVGIVSEGVDIPALKVLVLLNQITTKLFLVQIFGRVLRRIAWRKVKGRNGVEHTLFVDSSYDPDTDTVSNYLNATPAYVFAPAHPVIVDIGLGLEELANSAIKERGPDGPSEPSEQKERRIYETDSSEATTFYRDSELPVGLAAMLSAIEIDSDAMESLGSFWIDMILDWVRKGRVEDATEEVERRVEEFDIFVDKEVKTFNDNLDYDTETNLLRKEAQRLVQGIRFSHPAFKDMPDERAYAAIRERITKRVIGVWKPFNRLSLEQKRLWVRVANDLKKANAA